MGRGRWTGLMLGLLLTALACSPTADQIAQGNPYVRDLTADAIGVDAGGAEVRISAPRGFCIDPSSLRAATDGAVILIGDCTAIARADLTPSRARFSAGPVAAPTEARRAPLKAVMTVTVAPTPLLLEGDTKDRLLVLEDLIQSGLGQELLGRGGTVRAAERADVIQTRHIGDALFVLLDDRSATVAPRYWRAFAEENDRLVVMTITVLEDVYPGDPVSLRFLAALRESIRLANRNAQA